MRGLDAIIAVSDIAGFSQFPENSSPEQLVQALVRYGELTTGVVTASGGEVILRVGDAVICLWEASTDAKRQVEIGSALVGLYKVADQIVLPGDMRIRQRLTVASGRVARTDKECGGTRQALPIFGAAMDLAKQLNAACRVYQRNFLAGDKLPVIWPQNVMLEKLPQMADGISPEVIFAVKVDGQ